MVQFSFIVTHLCIVSPINSHIFILYISKRNNIYNNIYIFLRFPLFVFVRPICSWSGLSLVTRWHTNKNSHTIRLLLELNIEDENFTKFLNIEDENFHQIPRNGWKYVSANLWKIWFNFRPFWQQHTSDSSRPTFMFSFIQISWKGMLQLLMILRWYILKLPPYRACSSLYFASCSQSLFDQLENSGDPP